MEQVHEGARHFVCPACGQLLQRLAADPVRPTCAPMSGCIRAGKDMSQVSQSEFERLLEAQQGVAAALMG